MRTISLSKVSFGGLGLAALLVAIAFFFMNPEQCPEGYSQAQIDASNCVVGANIGLGIMLILAGFIAVVSVVLAVAALALKHKKA